MTAHDDVFNGVEIGRYSDSFTLGKDLNKYVGENVFFFCVGTDRSTGDSLAPLIGTLLQENGYKNVLGTISDPIHAQNLDEKIKLIPKNYTVIAIDSCLGKRYNIGTVTLRRGSLSPGSGVGKNLTKVGDYSINGVVNVAGGDNNLRFLVLQSTRLDTVFKIARMFVESVKAAYPIVENVLKLKEV